MPRYALRLLEDQFRAGPIPPLILPALHRVIYVVVGSVTVIVSQQAVRLTANTAWYSGDACTITSGEPDTRLWRWELVKLPVQSNGVLAVAAVVSTAKLSHEVELASQNTSLMRCDRVDFPPGGIAYTHTHQGPGIRCLLCGEFTVRVDDRATLLQPGGAWFESGPEPVYAAAADTGPAAFVRVMILPRVLKGKSSIRYVRPEDQDMPKPQRYTMFVDEPIEMEG